MKITLYTDGASRGNPGKGGWGVYVEVEKDKLYTSKISGGEKDTTNNKMELRATIEGLKYLKKNISKIINNDDVKIKIKTDSKYVKNGITEWIINWEKNNWKGSNKKPVANQELWKELLSVKNFLNDKLIKATFSEIKFEYVEGHAGIEGNEIADSLATEAADNLK
ncbi:MAG: ribonuclease HI [Candidatus Pacebacteria bacterium]|nr:ribonuclease HI [Candidatus Paceibacterota bacterium]